MDKTIPTDKVSGRVRSVLVVLMVVLLVGLIVVLFASGMWAWVELWGDINASSQ